MAFFQYKINFISKQVNPSNVPKARPIEDFWSMLADKVYDGSWEAKSKLQMKRRIFKKMKQIDIKIAEDMMKSIRTKFRKKKIKDHFLYFDYV